MIYLDSCRILSFGLELRVKGLLHRFNPYQSETLSEDI